MIIHPHAEKALIALTQKMPVPASVIIDRLKRESGDDEKDVAIIVCQMTMAYGPSFKNSNGDTVVVITRKGKAITAMLRRSWNQAFTPEVLRVDEVITWKEWTRV